MNNLFTLSSNVIPHQPTMIFGGFGGPAFQSTPSHYWDDFNRILLLSDRVKGLVDDRESASIISAELTNAKTVLSRFQSSWSYVDDSKLQEAYIDQICNFMDYCFRLIQGNGHLYDKKHELKADKFFQLGICFLNSLPNKFDINSLNYQIFEYYLNRGELYLTYSYAPDYKVYRTDFLEQTCSNNYKKFDECRIDFLLKQDRFKNGHPFECHPFFDFLNDKFLMKIKCFNKMIKLRNENSDNAKKNQ